MKRAAWWVAAAVVGVAVALLAGSDAKAPEGVKAEANSRAPAPEAPAPAPEATTRTLDITVRDCRHEPANGAQVEVFVGPTAPPITATTDERGHAQLTLPLGARSARVVAQLQREVLHRGDLAITLGPTPVEVGICPGATVYGVVRGAQGPLANAVVTFGDDSTTTEADGEFVLTDIWLESDRLTVSHALGSATRALARLAPNEERRVDVTLAAPQVVARAAPDEAGSDLVGTLLVQWRGPLAVQLVADDRDSGWPGATPSPRTLVNGVEALVPAPRFWRVEWVRGEQRGPCGEGLLMPGARLELRCGVRGDATVLARFSGEGGEPIAGRWRIRLDDGQELTGELDAAGALRASMTLDYTASASLRVEAPSYAELDRKGIVLTPGATTDLGTFPMMTIVSLAARFPEDRAAPFGGLGARIEATPLGIALTSIARDGPLDAAGILSGDLIIGVDGIPAGTLPTYEALRLMRGVPGSTLRLRLVRPDIGAFDIEVQRELIDAGAAEWLD